MSIIIVVDISMGMLYVQHSWLLGCCQWLHICRYILLVCFSNIWHICTFGRHIYLQHICNSKKWSIYCSCLCVAHICTNVITIQNEVSVTYACSVEVIFVYWYMAIAWRLCSMHTVLLVIWLMLVTSYMADVWIYLPYIYKTNANFLLFGWRLQSDHGWKH